MVSGRRSVEVTGQSGQVYEFRYDIGEQYDPVLGPRGGKSGIRYWSGAGQEFAVEYTPRR
jgi:hypothetical protein